MSHLRVKLEHRLSSPSSKDFTLNVNLNLPNAVTAVFGESGAGKTTLLRAVAGLERVPNAEISLGDTVWQDKAHFLATHKRQLSYVFQRAGLFPHLSVAENMAYGARRAPSPAEDQEAIYDLLNLGKLLKRMPAKLSGGEQQRVAIGRALMQQPKLLLLDEPLASLDQARKEEVLPYLEAVCAELSIPALYVSHSLDEISRLASHIVVLGDGRVVADGDLTDVLNQAELVSSLGNDHAVVLDAEVEHFDQQWSLLAARIPGGVLHLRSDLQTAKSAFRLRLNAKDVSIALSAHGDSSILNVLPASISALLPGPNAASTIVQLKLGDESEQQTNAKAQSTIAALITRKSQEGLQLEVGQRVWAQIKSVAVVR